MSWMHSHEFAIGRLNIPQHDKVALVESITYLI